ncbi:MAG: LacI family DNA-binding transcriptional regulator [Anaerolineales bacterium]|nr:LacI family DNA-binding transcriptional regulator [Anaerolineales bacterium]
MARKRVTIKQVAKEAGVSPTAVSFAFNNPEQISQETAERILSVAQEWGYSPNPIAKAMILQRTGVIGVLVPFTISTTFANPFINSFMQGVGSVCDQHSLSALVVSPYEGSLEEATRRALVDGYIVLGLDEKHIEIEPLRQRGIPFVIVDGDAETVSEVNVDDEGGAYNAACHLLGRGHRDILIVTFQQPAPSHLDHVYYGVGGRRLAGYKRAFADYGIEFRFDRIVQSLTSIEGGAAAFSQMWDDGFRPTAILALSDVTAIGVLSAANRLGFEVPRDLEVIGFDDIPMAAFTCPSLSTVHQPIVEKGRLAAELLVSSLVGDRKPEQVSLPTRLVLRDSTHPAVTR